MAIEVIQKGNLFVNRYFSELLDTSGLTTFDDFMGLEGKVVKRAVKERSLYTSKSIAFQGLAKF